MAITAADLQTEFGDGNPRGVRVIRDLRVAGSSLQSWLIDGGVVYKGRRKMIDTTASDSAATQAATILASLIAGPAGPA